MNWDAFWFSIMLVIAIGNQRKFDNDPSWGNLFWFVAPTILAGLDLAWALS